jgi:hypothetical protein
LGADAKHSTRETAGKAFSTLSRADFAHIAYQARLPCQCSCLHLIEAASLTLRIHRIASQACVSPAACRRTLAVLDGSAVIIAAPFLRELEAWEAAPFDEFTF